MKRLIVSIALCAGCADLPDTIDLPEDEAEVAAFDTALCPGFESQLQDSLDHTFSGFQAPGGAVMAVITPSCGLWKGATGSADGSQPMTPEHVLRIGSITKTFVATAVVQLAEEGAIGLDAPIGAYLPGVPFGDVISVKNLLNHTSGIPNYTDDAGLMSYVIANPAYYPPADIAMQMFSYGLSFPPGTAWSYSNTNYLLLGMIAQNVAQKPISAILHERVIDRAQLESTSFDGEEAIRGDLARGFAPNGVDLTHAMHPSLSWAAGAVVASADDVAAFARMLYRGALLSDPGMQQLLQMVPTTYGGVGYGLGTFGYSDAVYGTPGVGHGGDVPGYHADMVALPLQGAIVVAIVNSDASRPQSLTKAAVGVLLAQ